MRIAIGAAVLFVLAFAAAGCGGGSPSASQATTTTSTTTSTTPGARGAGFQAFAACLKQHGVTAPTGGRRPGGSGGGNGGAGRGGFRGGGFGNLTKAQQQAYTACRSSLPSGGFGGGGGRFRGGAGGGSQNPAFAKYTSCLKAHGVTFGKKTNATTFQNAETACAKYRPAGTPSGSAS